jgi:H+/Cl- antiporter ClcA
MWAALMVPMGCLVGLFSALFLASVDGATHARFDAPWLLYLLPLSGALQAIFYRRWARVPSGQRAFGVDFIIEQVHNPDTRRGRASVPARMGWMAWAGTVVSHLCGASVGREGTGLQLAASLANSYSWLLRRGSFGRLHLSRAQHRALTVASMAAGFAGVFATPFAATLFSLEVLEAGSGLATENIVPAIMAAASADIVAGAVLHALGKHHTAYPPSPPSGTDGAADELEVRMLLLVCVAALFFGLIARLFSWAVHALQSGFRALFASWSRTSEWGWFLTPILGGGLVIALVGIFSGDRTYLGIGTLRPEGDTRMVFLPSCFSSEGPCTDGAWAAKALFTVVSLASGYKGGEVTCLFFVGASAGWAVAQWFSVPSATHLFASAGFVSVFGAASNTPLASTLMAVELFGVSGGIGGGGRVLYYAAACAVSYVVSGQNGIYRAQRSTLPHKLARHERDDSSSSGGGRRRNPQQGNPHVRLEEVADAPAVSGAAGQQMA